jgi:hypothetical protein
MNKFLVALAGAAASILLPGAAQACRSDFLGTYNTRISRQDVFASDGLRLRNVGAILQQDRANYHRYHRRDRGDGYDDMFLSADSRSVIPRWMHDVQRAAAAAILRGDAWVNVRVHEGCIDVRLAS